MVATLLHCYFNVLTQARLLVLLFNVELHVSFRYGLIASSTLLCHGRLHTLMRLHGFGMQLSTHCYFCVGGLETDAQCSYARHILHGLLVPMGISADFSEPWHNFITAVPQLQNVAKRNVALLAFQIYFYHLWCERNAQAHNKDFFHHPDKLLWGIKVDLHSRLASTTWFSKTLCNRPELYYWIA